MDQIYTNVRKLEKVKEFWGNRINAWKQDFYLLRDFHTYPNVLRDK